MRHWAHNHADIGYPASTAGQPPSGSDWAKIRLADYAEVWIAQPGLRPRTAETYLGLPRRHVVPSSGW